MTGMITYVMALALGASPMLPAPDAACRDNAACYSAYLTYRQLTAEHGRIGVPLAVKLTILSEYWVVIDPSESIIQYTSGMRLREFGREAIARNLYEACGNQDAAMCGAQLYWFLSGFEPWLGWQCADGKCFPSDAAAEVRARRLARLLDYDNPHLNMDILSIINYEIANSYGWTRGARSDRPWQWMNRAHAPDSLGLGRASQAVLYVDVRPNCAAYRFAIFYTYAQTVGP